MPLTLEEAPTVIAGAHEHASQLGVHIAVAVVDEGGHLQALGRMDGSPALSAQIAETKAVGAALWHRDGDSLAAVHRERAGFFAQVDRLVRMPDPGSGLGPDPPRRRGTGRGRGQRRRTRSGQGVR